MFAASNHVVFMKKNRHAMAWWMWAGVVVVVSLATVACGPGRPATYPVEGKVVFPDGSPLAYGGVWH